MQNCILKIGISEEWERAVLVKLKTPTEETEGSGDKIQ